MKRSVDAAGKIESKAREDGEFRRSLLADPKAMIERELDVKLDADHKIHVHEESYTETHLVLPPQDKFTEAERQAAKTGGTSLEFLRATLYDPAPPVRPPRPERPRDPKDNLTCEELAKAGRESISLGLDFLSSTVNEDGALHCIRFNVSDPDIPRHFERPPFISAYCVLALESSDDRRAKVMCDAARTYLVKTIEYPGLWRYYRHLPQDLDSTALCSLVAGNHPWVMLGRNIPQILANRDEYGRFMTWILEGDEPDVVKMFRIEADPVVNANVIAYLGDRPETERALRWLESLIADSDLAGTSKWYPDPVAICYAAARAMIRVRPALDQLRPVLADRIAGLCDGMGDFGDVLQTAQAVSALHNIGCLERIDAKRQAERIIDMQGEDGSWPELLAFGDQSLKWGTWGQQGHGSESVTSAFCIEALENLVDFLKN
ncbi:MAG: hypothetical protein OXI60_06955 [Acidiferrobacterales bacterium]|nr:hypothetical protein [Acidiferrobacterales bacterium]